LATFLYLKSKEFRIILAIILIVLSVINVTVTAVQASSTLSAGEVVGRVEGTIAKVCQLVGDFDKERNQPTTSLTYSRYGVDGTDLGVSFEHAGKLIFLFGDTRGRSAFLPTGAVPGTADSWAYTMDENADECLNLRFYTGQPGSQGLPRFLPPLVPGVSQGAFEVPMEGIDIDGVAYGFFTTNHTEQRTMGGSILARLVDESFSFKYLYTFSTNKFVNLQIVPVKNSEFPGLPQNIGQGLLIWGSGEYRKSDPYLAWMPYESIEDKSKLLYFSGTDTKGSPHWSQSENDAVSIFPDPTIGELSVSWNQYLNRWIMLYRGVVMRSALLPWGPWSDRETVFDAATEGHGKFIHSPGKDNLSDPGRESIPGGPYGPYIIEKFTKGSPGRSTVYFTLSTWNPYTVVLMKVLLQLASRGVTRSVPVPTSVTTDQLSVQVTSTSTRPWGAAGLYNTAILASAAAAGLAVAGVIIIKKRRSLSVTRRAAVAACSEQGRCQGEDSSTL